MTKKLWILALTAITLSGCSQKNSFRIAGTFNGDDHKLIYVDRVDINTTERLDSAKINKKGEFHLKIRSDETDYYQLSFSPGEFITLLASPGEKIKLTFEDENLYGNYQVEGSAGSQLIKMLDSALVDTQSRLDSLRTIYENSASSPDFDTKALILDKAYSDLIINQRKLNIAFILENPGSLASIKALYQKISDDIYVLYEPRDLQFFKIVNDSLKAHYPASRHTLALDQYFQIELKKFNLDQITQQAMNSPSINLDPNLTDINGREIALSSLRGKYVLLSFWSVLSQVCIDENLKLKEIYKIYNKKGFEIYQINIDNSETTWREAVNFDELPWISVREDTAAVLPNTVLFNVQSLPANYLYDKAGEIIGKDLNSNSLQLRLAQLLDN